MLTMVIAKPIQVTRVIEVPFNEVIAFCATRLESWGESAITDMLQIRRKTNNKIKEDPANTIGDNKQQEPEMHNATVATFLAPNFSERKPPIIQETQPTAIMKKESRGIFKFR